MGVKVDTLQLNSDNYFTVKGIKRSDGDAISSITSVTAEILDSSFASLSPDTTITMTGIPETTDSYEGTFPDTITLVHDSTYYIEVTVVADGITLVRGHQCKATRL